MTVATIGNLSRDVVGGASPRPGGAVFYAARALARAGADARIVARCGAEDAGGLVPALEAFGVPVAFRPGARTTGFTFHYEGERRVMRVDAVGDPWTVEDVTDWVAAAIENAEWVQVGALLRTDFSAPTLAELAGGRRRLLVDAQGLVRSARIGPLELTGNVERETLRSLAALKLNDEEARILAGGTEPEHLRSLGVPEIVLTLGSAGALVVTEAHAEHIEPIALSGVVDPTGAGDSFSAGYVHHRAGGAEPVEAARAANALAAQVLGATGG